MSTPDLPKTADQPKTDLPKTDQPDLPETAALPDIPETLVINARLSAKYAGKKFPDEFPVSLELEYDTDIGPIRIKHTLEYLIKKYGLLSNNDVMLTGFVGMDINERKAAVVAALSYDMPAKTKRTLLCHALNKGYGDIARVIFDNGTQIFSIDPETSDVLLCGLTLPCYGNCSVLSSYVLTSADSRIALLENILKGYTTYPVKLLLDISKNLYVFFNVDIPEVLIQDLATFISVLYAHNPTAVISAKPPLPLRRILLCSYGIVYDTDLHAEFYAQFKERSAKLEAISAVLSKVQSPNEETR